MKRCRVVFGEPFLKLTCHLRLGSGEEPENYNMRNGTPGIDYNLGRFYSHCNLTV